MPLLLLPILLILNACLPAPDRSAPLDPMSSNYVGSSSAVEAPAMNPAGGTFDFAQSVALSCGTSGATIYYTTDGSVPTSNSTVYTGPINLSSSKPLVAIAKRLGWPDSAMVSNDYAVRRWQYVGTPGFSGTMGSFLGATVDGSTPYLAYVDGDLGGAVRVCSWNGATWAAVGTPMPGPVGSNCSLCATSAGGLVYVAYADGNNGGRCAVRAWGGADWSNVGAPFLSAGQAYPLTLANVAGIPHVAYVDYGLSGTGFVRAWNGTVWAFVGTNGFVSNSPGNLALLPDATAPMIAFTDPANANRLSVKSWNGSAWLYVGPPGFSTGSAASLNMDLQGSVPWVAISDGAYGNRATVGYWSGSTWVPAGPMGFAGPAYFLSLKIDGTTPYLAFQDGGNSGNSGGATVMRQDGTNWVTLGLPGFSYGSATYLKLFFIAGVPWVAFRDSGYGGRLTVMKFAP